ncbi:MAG: RloB family protein [Coriobacteriia bacterium]|nr:RloB family protein [Coriobacteriia bacterium]
MHVARRKYNTLKRKTRTREYKNVCWISAEGHTEKDYFSMDAFKDADVSIKFPRNIHPDRRNPGQVLKRFKKALRTGNFRKSDEAWIVVDVDTWDDAEFEELLSWAESDPRHHLAISNPKFELFLVMHYERCNGRTTPQAVDAALKKNWPRYAKRITTTHFSKKQVEAAIKNSRTNRTGRKQPIPAPGMTDAYLLAERLLGGGKA